MIYERHRWQVALVATVLLTGFAPIGYRLHDWQVARHEELWQTAMTNRTVRIPIEARRGDVYDARGVLLATSLPKKTLVADTYLLTHPELPPAVTTAIVRTTANALGVEERTIWEKFHKRTQYAPIARLLDDETVARVTNAVAGLNFDTAKAGWSKRQRNRVQQAKTYAIYVDRQDDFLRAYPGRTVAAHVVGYVNREHTGVSGIEAFFDGVLRGFKGYRLVPINGLGEALWLYEQTCVPPKDGLDVHLTLDQVIQVILEEELLKAFKERRVDGAVGIVMRPETGDILAMASLPNFDANSPGKLLEGQTEAEAAGRFRNRCIGDMHEPGSVFKIVAIGGALNERIVTLDDVFPCQTPFVYYGVSLNDHHRYGNLPVREITAKSSNVGVAKVALRLGAQRLYQYMTAFGFGSRTGVTLTGEAPGWVHPLQAWSGISIVHVPIGYEVAVTPLQMITAMCAIANGGRLMHPRIVSAVTDREGKVQRAYPPKEVRQVLRPDTAALETEALQGVTSVGGTGTLAADPAYDVAGKTGTARKVDPVLRRHVQRYYVTFCGFLPARHPELCILIALDNPNDPGGEYYAGRLAAPVFRAVAERVAKYMGIRPDRPGEENTAKLARANGH
jgi:cell division protein FtsI (penicillin-binding protein 3)/stage V sporulation protein D (sporulation-specific penicillin-binding protein)